MSKSTVPTPTTAALAAQASASRNRWLIIGGAALFILVFFLRFSASLEPKAQATQLAQELGAEVDLGEVPAGALGIALEDPSRPGATRKLGEFTTSKDLIVLHFWAGWCPPCMEELPQFGSIAVSTMDRQVQFLGVSYDQSWDDAQKALQKATNNPRPPGVVWLRDPAGQDGDPKAMLRLKFGTEQLPETYLIYQGRILARFVGSAAWTGPKMLQIFQLLAPPRTPGPT